MLAAIRSNNQDLRFQAAEVCLLYSPPFSQFLPVVRAGIVGPHSDVSEVCENALLSRGKQLSGQQIIEFELLSEENPEDLALKILLLGSYAHRRTSVSSIAEKARAVILEIFAHFPESWIAQEPVCALNLAGDEEAQKRAKEIWVSHAERQCRNPGVLRNAAQFLLQVDPALSEAFCRKGQNVEPKNVAWQSLIANACRFQAEFSDSSQKNALRRKALFEFQKAAECVPDREDLCRLLWDIVNVAIDCGELTVADHASHQLLQLCGNSPRTGFVADAFHRANNALGRLAFRRGEIARAISHLLASAEIIDSPCLMAFGPELELANELLRHGERTAVVSYLRRCSIFWQTPDHLAETWVYAIENGLVPELR